MRPCLVGEPKMMQSLSSMSSGVATAQSRIPLSYADASSSPRIVSRTRSTRTSAPSTARAPSAMTLASVTSLADLLKKTTDTRNTMRRERGEPTRARRRGARDAPTGGDRRGPPARFRRSAVARDGGGLGSSVHDDLPLRVS